MIVDKNPEITSKRLFNRANSNLHLINDLEDEFFKKHNYYPSEFESPESRKFLTDNPRYIHPVGDAYDQAYEKGIHDEELQKQVAKHYLGGAKDVKDATRSALEEIFGGPVNFEY